MDHDGADIGPPRASASNQACLESCYSTPNCNAWTRTRAGKCWLKKIPQGYPVVASVVSTTYLLCPGENGANSTISVSNSSLVKRTSSRTQRVRVGQQQAEQAMFSALHIRLRRHLKKSWHGCMRSKHSLLRRDDRTSAAADPARVYCAVRSCKHHYPSQPCGHDGRCSGFCKFKRSWRCACWGSRFAFITCMTVCCLDLPSYLAINIPDMLSVYALCC